MHNKEREFMQNLVDIVVAVVNPKAAKELLELRGRSKLEKEDGLNANNFSTAWEEIKKGIYTELKLSEEPKKSRTGLPKFSREQLREELGVKLE